MRQSSSATIKTELRREALARRDALPSADRAQAAETIAARAFPVAVASGAIVAGFMPMKSEINPLPLMRKLAAAGGRLADKRRNHPPPADAQARRRGRRPRAAGGGRAGQAVDHARLDLRRAARR